MACLLFHIISATHQKGHPLKQIAVEWLAESSRRHVDACFGVAWAEEGPCATVITGRFERELVVVMRRHRKQPEHLRNFVANILFG